MPPLASHQRILYANQALESLEHLFADGLKDDESAREDLFAGRLHLLLLRNKLEQHRKVFEEVA